MYSIINIKSISKFSVIYLWKDNKKNDINLSKIFWNKILDKDFLFDLLINKYLQDNKTIFNYAYIKKEIFFIINKLNLLKSKINFVNKNDIPWADDIFFSFRVFSAILFYINDYFSNDSVKIWLKEGIIFNKEFKSLEALIDNIEYFLKSDLINFLIKPIINNSIDKNNKVIYRFEIFWPDELILVWVLWQIINRINKNAKIAVDFSSWNEQFDFSQWNNLIKNANKTFFNYYDYFIIDRDFWAWLNQVKDFLNWKIDKKYINNIIFYDNKLYFNKIDDSSLNKTIFVNYIKNTFSWNNFSLILGEKSVYERFLPYKCYWNNCNFCTINSQNKFNYNKKYSYDFFVNKWINYIKENNIKSLNFKDEAIPPSVIIEFAKKILENNLKINYQFRTRFDKLYTYKNSKILSNSWCWFCWIWLESAVERINEDIWNKWNIWISIIDKIKIIKNFDKAWISFHNYSIMWFPWETYKESAVTYHFLKTNILKSNYYTCTPNIFSLMNWSKIFFNTDKYWIKINDEDLWNPFKLIYNFKYKWKKRNIELLYKFSEILHKIQFLPWLLKNNKISWSDFFNYIDRSYLFYLMKRYNWKSPYYLYKNINNNILTKDFNVILNNSFKISTYIQVFEYNNDINIFLYHWILCKDIKISKKYKSLILNYDNNINLLKNIEKNKIDVDNSLKKMIYLLLHDRILIKK